MDPLRLFHTVRHLRAVQVTDRVVRRLRPVSLGSPLAARSHVLVARAPELPAATPAGHVDAAGFRFLSTSRRFEGDGRWSPPDASRQWLYQLHCFRWLWEPAPAAALELLLDWLRANPPLDGPAWEPYPLSIRIREWTEWLLAHPAVGGEWRGRLTASLAVQVQALDAQLEYHLLGNHLLENAVTLCWAGLSLDGPFAPRWAARGARLLERQLAEQLLADGTHDERSPMYQSLLADGLLRLARIARAAGATRPAFASAADRIARAALAAGRQLVSSLRCLTHPDGGIALFGDSVFGEAATASELARRFPEAAPAIPPDAGVWALPAAGYIGVRRDGMYLAFDAGAIGPDHQPGHGHADALSFELSHRGRRILTDTGALSYETGDARAWDRGTAAHNTIAVDDRDQSELWGAFRCGRRIVPERATTQEDGGAATLRGGYAGPGAWRRPVRHRRTCRVRADGLSFDDELLVPGSHSAAARLHVAPGLSLVPHGDGVQIRDGASPIAHVRGDGFAWQVGESPYHPEFGRELMRPSLVARVPFSDRVHLSWSLRLS